MYGLLSPVTIAGVILHVRTAEPCHDQGYKGMCCAPGSCDLARCTIHASSRCMSNTNHGAAAVAAKTAVAEKTKTDDYPEQKSLLTL